MKYFSIEELTRSSVATKRNISNIPNDTQRKNLVTLVNKVLDKAREKFGKPIRVTSGFRSQELNRAIGGADNSQHTKGEAADISCEDNAELFYILRTQGNFDQLIWEYGDAIQPQWIHVSYRASNRNRNEVLRCVKQYNGKIAYLKI